MPGIFISHAGKDKPLVDAFVDNIVRLGCGVPNDLIFYSSGADTGVPAGSNLNAYVRDKVSDVGLVVALITHTFQTRPFCIAELGAAWSRVDNLFPLTSPGISAEDVEGVLAGMLVRSMDDGAALDELHDRICDETGTDINATTWGNYKSKWLKVSKPLLAKASAPSARSAPVATSHALARIGANRWGQLFDSFVDAALYTADDLVGREEIERAIELRTPIPGRYLYSSDSGADNWVRLCKDPMYRHHRESVEYWAGAGGRGMATLIKKELGRDDFDYVSLGSGDGQKDAELLASWLGSGSDIFYYPYDVSLPLVSRAIRAVHKRVPPIARSRLRIKAVLADFNHLSTVSEVFKHRDTPNVVALLGNSLGNLEQDLWFLRDLRAEMSAEDLLVLEVRLKSNDGPIPELATSQSLRFDFGPLEHYLGLTFDEEKMEITQAEDVSSIPNTSTTIVGCKDIEVHRIPHGEAKLIYIHEYDEENFLTILDENDFDIVEHKPGKENARFLVCVLRKRTT